MADIVDVRTRQRMEWRLNFILWEAPVWKRSVDNWVVGMVGMP